MTLRSLVVIVGISACGSEAADPAEQRGRELYMTNCIACHNANPTQPGALGPAVKGSPRELLEARILRAEYPPGYKPKRTTHQMVPLPQLAPHLDELAAYLK